MGKNTEKKRKYKPGSPNAKENSFLFAILQKIILNFVTFTPINRVWADIYVRGVYLASCLLKFKLRNFGYLTRRRATVDVYGCVTAIRHA